MVSRQFCGPLGNTFPRWSRAGGTACRQRFALSILLACSHHPPNLSGVPGGMLRPFLDLLIRPLQPGMHSTCTPALIILLCCFPNKSHFFKLPYNFETLPRITCNHSTKGQRGYFWGRIWVTQHKHFSSYIFFGTSPFLLELYSSLTGKLNMHSTNSLNRRHTLYIRRKRAISGDESLGKMTRTVLK